MPKNRTIKSNKRSFLFGCWNVRRMLNGITNDLKSISDAHKTAFLNQELPTLNSDIAALQETRLADSGNLRESQYTFFWKGKKDDKADEHGVSSAVNLLDKTQLGCSFTTRLMSKKLNKSDEPTHLLCVHATTINNPCVKTTSIIN